MTSYAHPRHMLRGFATPALALARRNGGARGRLGTWLFLQDGHELIHPILEKVYALGDQSWFLLVSITNIISIILVTSC